MQAGQIALYLASGITLLVALIGFYGTRSGGLMTRRNELDKIYMARLATVEEQNRASEAECDRLRAVIHELREQHLADLTSVQRVKVLEGQVETLMTRLIGSGETGVPKPGHAIEED